MGGGVEVELDISGGSKLGDGTLLCRCDDPIASVWRQWLGIDSWAVRGGALKKIPVEIERDEREKQ